jgi:methylated-DNA-protein-cysteine methyltransferase-like protein
MRGPGPKAPSETSSYQRIYDVVRRIPAGRVATYGQVAALAGIPGHARQVGYALHSLPDGSQVPWHRVINARGEISSRAEPGPAREGYQRFLLEEEDVVFDLAGRVDLEHFRWQPDGRPRRSPRAAKRSSASRPRSAGGSKGRTGR